jgi:hypothetical protein
LVLGRPVRERQRLLIVHCHTEPVGLLLVSGWSGWPDYRTTVEITEDFLHADSRADAAPGA